MSATVSQLGARALRKLGVALVAAANQPLPGPTFTALDVVSRVLRDMGILTSDADRPASLGTVGQVELGARVCRAVAINPIAGTVSTDTTDLSTIAIRALRASGTNPISGIALPIGIVTPDEIARRALRSLGVNPVDTTGAVSGLSYTQAQVGTMMLLKLAIIAADETPASFDQAYAESKVVAVHDELVGLNMVSWGLSAVPASVVEYYVILAALQAAPGYGKSVASLGTGSVSKSASSEVVESSKQAIFQQALSGTFGQQRAVARVGSVQDEIASAGLADWVVNTIPTYAADIYVSMVAALLAMEHGRPADPKAHDDGIGQLRRIVLSGPRGAALANDRAQTVHSNLVAKGLADWAGIAIPVGVADAYVLMVMQELGPVYGRPMDMPAMLAAEDDVRRVVLSGPRGQALAETKVQATQDALNALGLVTWAVSAVPMSYADDYVAMATTLFLPVVRGPRVPGEIQADAAVWSGAVDRIRAGEMVRGAPDRALAKIRAVHDELNDSNLVSWSISAIPGSMVDAYASMAVGMMREEAGKAPDVGIMQAGMERVRALVMGGVAGQALAEQKVRAVHSRLDAMGRARWSLYDLPQEIEQPYVDMAAFWLAPEFGIKADPSWWALADMDITRIISLPSRNQPVQADYF